jgi:hypothetical protein
MVKRGNVFEVWTAREFPANSLILAPECSEIKDKYWTQGRSAMTRNGSSHHPENKQIVLDGRLRSSPSEVRPCSVFFVVQRSMKTEECNLKMDYTSLEISAKVLGTKLILIINPSCLHTLTHPEINPVSGFQSYGFSRCARCVGEYVDCVAVLFSTGSHALWQEAAPRYCLRRCRHPSGCVKHCQHMVHLRVCSVFCVCCGFL